MDKKYLNDEFDRFFEFHAEDRSHVSSVSSKLFAEHIAYPILMDNAQFQNEVAELKRQLEAARKDSARWSMIEMLMFLGNVELYQDDSGGYSIDLDPVENIVAQRWTGNSPEEAIDSVIGQIKPVCQTCKGRGVIGGFVSIEAGYQDDPCPECSATVINAPEASELNKGGA